MFGLQVPKEILDAKGAPRSWWGARAIFKPMSQTPIDIPFDRQQFEPPLEKCSILLTWLNEVGMPWLKSEAVKLNTDEDRLISLQTVKGTIQANPMRSYGYLHIGAWRYDTEKVQYELEEIPKDAKWSGKGRIPAIGEQIGITFNQFGTGVVLDYMVENGWLGLRVHLDRPPEWYRNQNPHRSWAVVFGAEIRLLEPTKKS